MKGDCSTVLLFFKEKKILGSGGICIRIKKLGALVSRYPFPGRDEADSFNLRGLQLGPFIRGKIRSVRLT